MHLADHAAAAAPAKKAAAAPAKQKEESSDDSEEEDGYVEDDLGREQLILRGFSEADVDRVIALVDSAEYKRRQAPPGIKITTKAFGRDRRMPITNRYRG